MPDSTPALYGLAGGALAAAGIVSTLVALAIYVLQIIGWWKIFTKAGEAGWKSLIPLYNLYILYKISWESKYFWYLLLTVVASGVVGAIGGVIGALLSGICSIATLVLYIMLNYKLSRSFGHGGGYTVGLIFIPWLFVLILGFGSSESVRGFFIHLSRGIVGRAC